MRQGLRLACLCGALLWGLPVLGGMIVRRTREDGANAIRFGGQTRTLDDWIAFREERPGWFAQYNPRLGRALAMGKDALIARRDLNPARFDRNHRSLGYLLSDPYTHDPRSAGFPSPSPDPPDIVPEGPILTPDPPGTNPPGPPSEPQASPVPEPSSLLLAVMAIGLACAGRRIGRLGGRSKNRVSPPADA